jgi:hypothetical protein
MKTARELPSPALIAFRTYFTELTTIWSQMESTRNESGRLGKKAEGILRTIFLCCHHLQQQHHEDQHLPILSMAGAMKHQGDSQNEKSVKYGLHIAFFLRCIEVPTAAQVWNHFLSQFTEGYTIRRPRSYGDEHHGLEYRLTCGLT